MYLTLTVKACGIVPGGLGHTSQGTAGETEVDRGIT